MRYNFLLTLLLVSMITSCDLALPQEPDGEKVLAAPIDLLTPEQLNLHLAGDGDFAKTFAESEGLGPIFVQISCESCHVGDGKGSPINSLTRFGRYSSDGITWDPMLNEGGPQLQHRSIGVFRPEVLPQGVESSEFIAPNVTGLGYLGAVSDSLILELADPFDQDNNGISGVVNHIEKPDWLQTDQRYHRALSDGTYIGRFGRKASAINLHQQTVGAYNQDMGITSEFAPDDPINYLTSNLAGDNVDDPEVSASVINKVVFYLQTLKAPQRRNTEDADVIAGEILFREIGCESCHKSELKTAPSEIAALDQVTFYPYTDMLLHDMGPELDDNYTEGSVKTFEWRTMPLWGLGLQQNSQGAQVFLLHDGRATSYEEAIQFHGGEAASSRESFMDLSEVKKDQVIKFLNSL